MMMMIMMIIVTVIDFVWPDCQKLTTPCQPGEDLRGLRIFLAYLFEVYGEFT